MVAGSQREGPKSECSKEEEMGAARHPFCGTLSFKAGTEPIQIQEGGEINSTFDGEEATSHAERHGG